MKQFLLVCILVLVAAVIPDKTSSRVTDKDLAEWKNFKSTYNKVYKSKDEEQKRLSIFIENKRFVDEFNAKSKQNNKTSRVSVNALSDQSKDEMKHRMGFRVSRKRPLGAPNTKEADTFLDSIFNDNSIQVPDELDWRQVPGRVTDVKYQGDTTYCWAFAAVGALEGQEIVRSITTTDGKFINRNELIELSEQNLIDCLDRTHDLPDGGVYSSFYRVHKQGGIHDRASYPFQGETTSDGCKFNKDNVVFSTTGAASIQEGNEDKLKEVVAKFGPVAVGIDASGDLFTYFKEGVYYNENCRRDAVGLNHAVLIVGYGTDPNEGDYWLIKNSWGKHVHVDGYLKMARNRDNHCGIATIAVIPTF